MTAIAEPHSRRRAPSLGRAELRASAEGSVPWARFATPRAADPKALLESALLDDIDLSRPHDTGRDITF